MSNNRLWIVPKNDLEAITIIENLHMNEEEYLVTNQEWGASWENLEEEIKLKVEEAKKAGKQIYGIELQGDSKGAINIDHHIYGDDDRSNPKSSLEQVADILGVGLSFNEMFIAANDRGYIPEMEKLGAKWGTHGPNLQEIINYVRMREREAQGITIDQEAQAEDAIERLGTIKQKNDYILIDELPHSKTATITDRLYGKYDNLLVISKNGESNFFGAREIINRLNKKFKVIDEKGESNCWQDDGANPNSGFWGGYVDQEELKKEVGHMISELIKHKKAREEWKKLQEEDPDKASILDFEFFQLAPEPLGENPSEEEIEAHDERIDEILSLTPEEVHKKFIEEKYGNGEQEQ